MYKRTQPDSVVVEVATELFKHQNFKAESLCKKYKQTYYADSSLKAMLSILRNYLTTGKRDNKRVSPLFYSTVDDCINKHVQPLTPSVNDSARLFKRKPQKSKRVIVKSATPVRTEKQVTNPLKNNFKLALQVDDMIKICPNQSYLDGYMDAFKQMEKQLGQAVNIKQVKINIIE